MLTEIAKLNQSQRKVMRKLVPCALTALTVDKYGYQTRIVAESLGFRHTVVLGSRGMILSRHVMEA